MHCTLLTVANTDHICRMSYKNELISVSSVKCVHKVENIRVTFILNQERKTVSSLWGDVKYIYEFMSALTVLEIAVCYPFLSEK